MARVHTSLMAAAAASIVAALALAQTRTGDLILYNHSPSIPVGFYVRSGAAIERGAFVTVRAAHVAPTQARERDFEDPTDRFIKRIAALGGDEVCARRGAIIINGELAAERRATDSRGRPLPAWQGCRTLSEDEIFLVGDTADSFDGRYWGPVRRSQIEGVWRKI